MANEVIRHARAVSPWFIPNKGGNADDLHGIIDIGGGASVDKTDLYVVGKKAKCGTDKQIPKSTVSITQRERGEIDTYLVLANLASEPSSGITLEDFSNGLVDVALYEKDSFDGNLEQTIWFPKTAISSLNFNISGPEAVIERSFDLTGDNKHELNYDNKYLIHKKVTVGSGVSGNYTIDVSDPAPKEDPNNSGQYILRIDRTRSGTTTTLELTTDYTYNNSSKEITILSAITDDVYNVYYSSDSFGTSGDPTTVDPCSDPNHIKGSYVTVLISDGTNEVEMDLLTSLSISATLNRVDESVIGNDERILREISDTPVTVSLSGRVKTSTFAEAFMGKLSLNHGITDVKEYIDTVKVTVKVYSDASKSSFLIGYQVDNLSFASDSSKFTANEFGTIDLTASSDEILITTNVSNL